MDDLLPRDNAPASFESTAFGDAKAKAMRQDTDQEEDNAKQGVPILRIMLAKTNDQLAALDGITNVATRGLSPEAIAVQVIGRQEAVRLLQQHKTDLEELIQKYA